MNVANLQLEGLLLAVASVNHLLVRKGVLTTGEIDEALRKVQASVTGDDRTIEDLRPANRDAICFPIRFLQLANNGQSEHGIQPFAELARAVGQMKEPYNDQR